MEDLTFQAQYFIQQSQSNSSKIDLFILNEEYPLNKRKLSWMEEWYISSSGNTNIIVVNELQFSAQRPKNWFQLLESSLFLCGCRHPFLRASINSEHNKNEWVFRDIINIENEKNSKIRSWIEIFPGFTFNQITTEEEWKLFLEKELNFTFAIHKNSLLWKASIILNEDLNTKNFFVIFVYNHCIGDGFIGMRWLNDLLYYYNFLNIQSMNTEAEEEMYQTEYLFNLSNPIQSLPILPSLDSILFPQGLNFSQQNRANLLLELENTILKNEYSSIFHSNLTKNKKCSFEYLEIESQIFIPIKQLISSCEVSMGSFISGLIHFILAKKFLNFRNGEKKFRMELDVNLRKRMNNIYLGDDHFGLFVGMLHIENKISFQINFWKLCQEIYSSIQTGIANEDPQLWYFLNSTQQIDSSSTEENEIYGDCNLSNLGTYPFLSNYETITIQKIFTLATNVLRGWNFVFITQTVNNILTVSITYLPSRISSQITKEILQELHCFFLNSSILTETYSFEDYVNGLN